jgi:anti-sigma factor RsiW
MASRCGSGIFSSSSASAARAASGEKAWRDAWWRTYHAFSLRTVAEYEVLLVPGDEVAHAHGAHPHLARHAPQRGRLDLQPQRVADGLDGRAEAGRRHAQASTPIVDPLSKLYNCRRDYTG